MPKKLLIADDSITIQKVVSLTFAGEDVLIEAVSNGDQAIEKAKSMKPDIVLADVFMPGRNGYEVCELIKGDPELTQIPVVLLVGAFEPFDEAEASRVKCDAYLTKPFDTSELIQTVHSLVDSGSAPSSMKAPKTSEPSPPLRNLVSTRTRESFLGPNKLLDLFALDQMGQASGQVIPSSTPAVGGTIPATAAYPLDPLGSPAPSANGAPAASQNADNATVKNSVIPFPGVREVPGPAPVTLSEEILDLIAEKVVRRMSQQVVKEIAWEVVPELAEVLIKQTLNEGGTDNEA